MDMESKWEHALQRNVCPNCGSIELITDNKSGEVYCSKCGFVLSKIYDMGQEWREFGDEESQQRDRAGSPLTPLIHDLGFTTAVEFGTRSASGRGMTSEELSRAQRMRVWQERGRAMSANERNLMAAMRHISHLADQLNIGRPIVTRAASIYREALEMGLVKGRPISSMAAAVVYAACRSSEVPRTLKEVATKAGLRKKEVARAYRNILRAMEGDKMPISDPTLYISKVASKLKLGPEIERETEKILGVAKKKKTTSGKDPMGLVAAAMYMATLNLGITSVTQKQIAEAANVTEVTVRNRFKGLKDIVEKP